MARRAGYLGRGGGGRDVHGTQPQVQAVSIRQVQQPGGGLLHSRVQGRAGNVSPADPPGSKAVAKTQFSSY